MIMTNREQRIQEEVDKTLQLLDHIEKPAVNPFFYGKLEHRMKTQSSSSLSPNIWSLLMPKLALMTLMLLFICNIFTLTSPETETTSAHADQGLQIFAEQYNITTTQ